VRDLWDNRRGRPKPEPTVGEEEHPTDSVRASSEQVSASGVS
jgi:hypothetical protein